MRVYNIELLLNYLPRPTVWFPSSFISTNHLEMVNHQLAVCKSKQKKQAPLRNSTSKAPIHTQNKNISNIFEGTKRHFQVKGAPSPWIQVQVSQVANPS